MQPPPCDRQRASSPRFSEVTSNQPPNQGEHPMKESNRSFGNLRRSTLAGFIALATLGLAAAALGYGKDGHETVGAIAADLLQGTHAETKVNNLLQGMSLLDAATWADRAKGSQGPLTQEMKDFVAANHDHHNYHYTDVPIQELQYQLG